MTHVGFSELGSHVCHLFVLALEASGHRAHVALVLANFGLVVADECTQSLVLLVELDAGASRVLDERAQALALVPVGVELAAQALLEARELVHALRQLVALDHQLHVHLLGGVQLLLERADQLLLLPILRAQIEHIILVLVVVVVAVVVVVGRLHDIVVALVLAIAAVIVVVVVIVDTVIVAVQVVSIRQRDRHGRHRRRRLRRRVVASCRGHDDSRTCSRRCRRHHRHRSCGQLVAVLEELLAFAMVAVGSAECSGRLLLLAGDFADLAAD